MKYSGENRLKTPWRLKAEITKKKISDCIHGKRLDCPVDKQSQKNRPAAFSRLDDFTEVDFYHDRIHHQKQTHGNRNRDNRCTVHENRHAIKSFREIAKKVGRERCKTPSRYLTTMPITNVGFYPNISFGSSPKCSITSCTPEICCNAACLSLFPSA